METTNWKYDFSSLPKWELRKEDWTYDEYHELPTSDTLCCIYSIREARMLSYLGFLAIFKNQKDPQLIANIHEGYSFRPGFFASADGTILFLQPEIYYKDINRVATPILVIDLKKERFAFINTANYNPCYTFLQQSETVFIVEADEYQRAHDKWLNALHGKKIRTRFLRWHPMAQLSRLPVLLF